jgi:hypothetical protein
MWEEKSRWLEGFPQRPDRPIEVGPAPGTRLRVRERATSCSGGKRSIQLSYGPDLWEGENSLPETLSATTADGVKESSVLSIGPLIALHGMLEPELRGQHSPEHPR